MQTRDDIFNTLRDALVELFELEPERISLGSNLYQDLEIDSIDAVDLIDHIKRQTGKKNRRRRIQIGAYRQRRGRGGLPSGSTRRMSRLIGLGLLLAGLLYPFAVYFGMEHFAPWQFGLLLGSLWLARALTGERRPGSLWMATVAIGFFVCCWRCSTARCCCAGTRC